MRACASGAFAQEGRRAFELAVARGDEELLGALVVARELVEAALDALVLGDLVLELLTQALVLLLRRICAASSHNNIFSSLLFSFWSHLIEGCVQCSVL